MERVVGDEGPQQKRFVEAANICVTLFLAGWKAPHHLIGNWMKDICAGLAELHAEDIIVADLKPANVLLDEFDSAVISDFGVSSAVFSIVPAPPLHTGGTPIYQLRCRTYAPHVCGFELYI